MLDVIAQAAAELPITEILAGGSIVAAVALAAVRILTSNSYDRDWKSMVGELRDQIANEEKKRADAETARDQEIVKRRAAEETAYLTEQTNLRLLRVLAEHDLETDDNLVARTLLEDGRHERGSGTA